MKENRKCRSCNQENPLFSTPSTLSFQCADCFMKDGVETPSWSTVTQFESRTPRSAIMIERKPLFNFNRSTCMTTNQQNKHYCITKSNETLPTSCIECGKIIYSNQQNKTEQCFCKSYYDDSRILQDCTCGKCGNTNNQQNREENWEEEFDKKFPSCKVYEVSAQDTPDDYILALDARVDANDIKQFIRSTRQSAAKEAREEVLKEVLQQIKVSRDTGQLEYLGEILEIMIIDKLQKPTIK